MSGSAPAMHLPVVPRPEENERLSSWLGRIARLYSMPMQPFLECCGLKERSVAEFEWRLEGGEGALLARRTGMTVQALKAMTFEEIAPQARPMIAQGSRYVCPQCSGDALIHRKAAALPWSFWCPVHRARLRSAGGSSLETLLLGRMLSALDPYAKRGADRFAAWAEGRDEPAPAPPDLMDFLTARHRRPSPPSLDEQPPLSLQARRANHEFLNRPIVRQALLVVAPEYDRAAPLIAKPVRPGLFALSRGSLLQNYAMAVSVGRLTDNPVEHAVAVLAASDREGEQRIRDVLQVWPLSLRRRIFARFRRFRAAQAPGQFAARLHVRGGKEPSVSNPDSPSLTIMRRESHNRARDFGPSP